MKGRLGFTFFREILIWCIVGIVLFPVFTSCMQDDEFSTSPDDGLVFSQDTIAFDTIISGQPTNTYTFQVYNPSTKALRISKVYLEGGSGSP